LKYTKFILFIVSVLNIETTLAVRCGRANGRSCPFGYCCSKDGGCGKTGYYCGYGCQFGYGRCDIDEPEVTSTETTGAEPTVDSVSCIQCINCVDCDAHPDMAIHCPSTCIKKPINECPGCTECVNCEENPEIRKKCPDACYRKPDCFRCLECVDCEVQPEFAIYCPFNCISEETLKCPSCEECVDCDEEPEIGKSCPGACIRKPDCFRCLECVDCDEQPEYAQYCPFNCIKKTTENPPVDIPTENVDTDEMIDEPVEVTETVIGEGEFNESSYEDDN